jgi:DNA polymerase-3 subunit gamma/tau
MLSQNAQVAAVDDTTLTLALLNAGARDSFLRSGSDEILRQAAIDVIGTDWRVDTIVDPSAQPGAQPDSAPRVTKHAVEPAASPGFGSSSTEPDSSPPPAWATGGDAQDDAEPKGANDRSQAGAPGEAPAERRPPRQPVDPTSVASARGAIQPTRAAGTITIKESTVSDEDAHRDDADADDNDLGGAQLLERELGARVIEEIKHD